jgi:hypothetical protein
MKESNFRRWVGELWRKNCEEYLTVSQTPYTMEEYWTRYKYWLKREFRYQRNRHDNAS